MAPGPTAARGAQASPTPTLASALTGFLRASGLDLALKHPEIYAVWQEVVGPELAAHARVLGFRRGILVVAVDSSALMTDIQFHRATLLAALRRQVRKPPICGVSFVVKPILASHDQQEQA